MNCSFFLCLAASRTRPSAWVTRSRPCVRSVLCCSAFPLVPGLGSTGSATGRPALFVGFIATMPESDFSGSCISGYGSSPSRYGPSDPTGPMADPEISRFPHKERPYMPGSQTTPGPTGARNNAPADFAFRQVNNVGTRIDNGFAAQWLAYTLPYRRFADVLADACARIGGDVDCYSFIAVDFHHILLASLPAHSLALRPVHSRSHQIRDRYPGASDISSPPCLPRLLPAGAIAGWALHPLEKRRLVTAHVDPGP